MVSQAPGDHRAHRVARGGPPQSTRDPGSRDTREVWQRSGSGVCRSLLARVLETQAGQVGALPGRQGRGGEPTTFRIINFRPDPTWSSPACSGRKRRLS